MPRIPASSRQGPVAPIQDRVVDVNSGFPVAGAEVRLAKDDSCVEWKDAVSERSLIAWSSTGAYGAFIFAVKLPPELGAVVAEGKPGSRQDVRGQGLRAVHQRELGDEIERSLVVY